jgi:hypothetical protein
MLRRLLLLLLLAHLAGCASTTFSSTWKSPDAGRIDFSGQRVAAVFVSPEASVRRAAEDELARELDALGADGVAAYTVVDDAALADQAQARQRLLAAGCQGAVVMRISDKEQRLRSSPELYTGVRYSSFSSYSGWGWRASYPVAVETDTIVSVETLVYRLSEDEILWGGHSRTFNPRRLEDFIAELCQAVWNELETEGLVEPR